MIPGPLIILLAVLFHWLVLGQDSGVEWWTFVVLIVLLTASQILTSLVVLPDPDGFGGTKWGATGAIIGAIVGLFFMPFGLILGPLIGASAFELLFAKLDAEKAAVSGVGSCGSL